MTRTKRLLGLAIWIIVCLGAGGLGAYATTPEINGWYRTLNKPSFNPPDSLFGPVWTTLYVLMAIAAWQVWKAGGFRAAAGPLTLFGVQLTLNIAWSFIFFGLHQTDWALIELVALWIAIAATAVAFWKRSPVAGWLLTPYLAWVTFAGVLNFMLWRLN